MSLLKQKPNLLRRAGWPPVQGWWSPDYRGRNNTREMTAPSWVLVPTLKPIFSLLSMENVPTLHANKLFGWLVKGSINDLFCPRHPYPPPPTVAPDTGLMPLSLLALGSCEQTAQEGRDCNSISNLRKGTWLGPGCRALDKGYQRVPSPLQRPGLPAAPHKAFLLQPHNRNNRCCKDQRLTSAECIFFLRKRYLTKRRNYAAKHQIGPPNPGFKNN